MGQHVNRGSGSECILDSLAGGRWKIPGQLGGRGGVWVRVVLDDGNLNGGQRTRVGGEEEAGAQLDGSEIAEDGRGGGGGFVDGATQDRTMRLG